MAPLGGAVTLPLRGEGKVAAAVVWFFSERIIRQVKNDGEGEVKKNAEAGVNKV